MNKIKESVDPWTDRKSTKDQIIMSRYLGLDLPLLCSIVFSFMHSLRTATFPLCLFWPSIVKFSNFVHPEILRFL